MPLPRIVRAAALRVPGLRRRYDHARRIAVEYDALQREHVRQADAYAEEIHNLKQALDQAYAEVHSERSLAEAATAEREATGERTSKRAIEGFTPAQILYALTEPDAVNGKAYSVRLPGHIVGGDTNEEPGRSRLQVLEDGVPLGPAHAPHSDIADEGGGRYSHWGDSLLFSSSDNSDPRTNGRAYHVLLPARGRSATASPASARAKVLHPISSFEAQGGHTFSSRLPAGLPPGDAQEDPGRSRLQVLEDGVPLGPAHALHSAIADEGEGRYSHWDGTLLFSSSDNSDPRHNGRAYHLFVPQQDRVGDDGRRDRTAMTADERESARNGLDAESARSKVLNDELEAFKLQVYVLRSDLNRSVARSDSLRSELHDADHRTQQAMQDLKAAQARASEAENACERQEAHLAQLGDEITERDLRLTELQAQAAHSAELQLQNVLQTRRSEDLHAQLEKAITWRAELDHSYSRLLGATSLISADLKGLRQSLRARGADEAVRDVELRQRYLDLLESALTGRLYGDSSISPWAGYDPEVRQIGRDWPSLAQTMIGTVRMRNIRTLAEQILEDGIAGDFLEAGVWRGGACIYMRGILEAYADSGRTVFAADSFAGLPKPDQDLYPADAHDLHHTVKELAIPLEEVKKNFAHYSLLDNQVVFLEGWFKDTLPSVPVEKLALLRLDGDMYSSTTETLEALYWKVSPGGFVIIDDYILPACRSAVEDFRARMRITDIIQDIDGAGVYWRKTV